MGDTTEISEDILLPRALRYTYDKQTAVLLRAAGTPVQTRSESMLRAGLLVFVAWTRIDILESRIYKNLAPAGVFATKW